MDQRRTGAVRNVLGLTGFLISAFIFWLLLLTMLTPMIDVVERAADRRGLDVQIVSVALATSIVILIGMGLFWLLIGWVHGNAALPFMAWIGPALMAAVFAGFVAIDAVAALLLN